MYTEIKRTENPPKRPTLIWDGTCGFCKFWKTNWESKTQGKVFFETYQEKAQNFPDIPLKEFKKASRLIEPDGKVYSGPDSAYRSLYHSGNKKWHQYFNKYTWFKILSKKGYNHIAKNRSFYFKLTKICFGSNPKNLKPFWLIYLAIIFLLLIIVF